MPTPKLPTYPFRRLDPAAEPTEDEARSLVERSETAAGAPPKPPQIPKAHLDREKALSELAPSPADVTVPNWLAARVTRAASSRQVVDDVVKRLRRAPSARNLRESAALLNELARRRGGGQLVRDTLTQTLVDEFQAKSED